MSESGYILVRYSEIALKGRNRFQFERKLIENIKAKLKNNLVDVIKYPGRIVLRVRNENLAIKELPKVFGIKSFSPCVKYKFSDLKSLIDSGTSFFKEVVKNKTFKVDCTRVGSHDFTSYDVCRLIGEKLSKYGKVDVKNPEVTCYVEIRNKDCYLFTEIYEAFGGLPVGSEGKVLAMISGGFDSPVAAWLAMKRGCLVDFLFADFGREELVDHVRKIVEHLRAFSPTYECKLFVVDFREIIDSIKSEVDRKLWITVFKKALYTVAEGVAEKIGAIGLVTGESLGQKASQTLENLRAASYGIKTLIYRPLFGFDKDEIIRLSRKVGLYELCAKTPEQSQEIGKNPKTKCDPEEIEEAFKKIGKVVKKAKITVY